MGRNKKKISETSLKNIKQLESPEVISSISSNKVHLESDIHNVTESVKKAYSEVDQSLFKTEDLHVMKNNIMQLRSDIDNLLNKVIGIELQLE